MKGYKAFNKGLVCKGKQYSENTTFEEDKAEICNCGMHFCDNPLDTLNYYPLISRNNELTEFAEVEALDEVKTDGNKKYCTKKLHIGAKIELPTFIKASVEFIFERCNSNKINDDVLAQSGDYSKSAQSGDYSKSAQSGDYSQSAQSGDYSCIELLGKNCVGANIGINGKIKGVKGSWITLAEYNENGICICVKSAKITGKALKADTWYTLKNGKFMEVMQSGS